MERRGLSVFRSTAGAGFDPPPDGIARAGPIQAHGNFDGVNQDNTAFQWNAGTRIIGVPQNKSAVRLKPGVRRSQGRAALWLSRSVTRRLRVPGPIRHGSG